MMGDVQQYFIDHQVRNFYSVSISGLPHRRSRGEPDLASSRSRSPTASRSSSTTSRAAWRSTTSRPTCRSSSPTAWTPSTRSSAAWPAGSGRGRCASATARARAARCSSTTSRPRARSLHAQEIQLQRHPHHAAGAVRDLRQLQLPAHQRLRRGDHHADRGVGAPRGGDPADHQPRARPELVREPLAGLVRDRGTHRPGRGGGLRGVRADLRARRRARRDGHHVPALQDPGGVAATTSASSTTARCR